MKSRACLCLLGLWTLGLLAPAGGAQDTAPRAGEVTAVLPTALIHRGTQTPVPAVLRGEVRWRDLMETQPRARARIALLDGSILNVGSDARLLIARHDEQSQQTELEVRLGKLRARVQKLTRPDSSFILRTNTAVIGVIGTHVYADAQPETTTVINLDTGRSRVRSSEAGIAGEQILEPFELTSVARGQPPTPKRLATFEEILQAILDTLPGPSLPLGSGHARAGSCTYVVPSERLVDADGDGRIAALPFLELRPAACGGSELTPINACVPVAATPGLYEFPVPTAAGERLSAFLVRPAEPPNRLEGARLVYAPAAPPGSIHYARLLDAQNRPLEGVPVRLRTNGQESVVHTDAAGGFPVRVPERGRVEMTVDTVGQATSSATGPAPAPLAGSVEAGDIKADELKLPDAIQRGDVLNVPGEVMDARLGERSLPVVRTVTQAGRTISTIAVPPDVAEGDSQLALRNSQGKQQQRPLVVFEILGGRIDQAALSSGMESAGEFLACVGGAPLKRVRARIVAIGPVHFRGKGAKGKVYEQQVPVGPGGLVRIPFQIRAEKGGLGVGIPFTLRLTLSR